MPAVIAVAASTVIQAMLAYSSQKPRRVSLCCSSAGISAPGHGPVVRQILRPSGRCRCWRFAARVSGLAFGLALAVRPAGW